jgi:hypothetical protein
LRFVPVFVLLALAGLLVLPMFMLPMLVLPLPVLVFVMFVLPPPAFVVVVDVAVLVFVIFAFALFALPLLAFSAGEHAVHTLATARRVTSAKVLRIEYPPVPVSGQFVGELCGRRARGHASVNPPQLVSKVRVTAYPLKRSTARGETRLKERAIQQRRPEIRT